MQKIEGKGSNRKAATLNYEKYSRSLSLEPLPKDCDEEVVMELILKQAREAAKKRSRNLIRCSNQDVGGRSPYNPSSSHHNVHVKPSGVADGKQASPSESRCAEAVKFLQKVAKNITEIGDSFTLKNQDVGGQSPNKRSSSHRNAHIKSSGVAEGKQDLPSASTHVEALKVLQKIPEHIMKFCDSFTRKVSEREELESKVAGVKNSGVILLPDLGPDNFEDELACLKLLFSADLSRRIEVVEQEYNSEEFKCRKLREIVQDHNSKSIHEGLMRDGDMTGRQRADESVRLPPLFDPAMLPVEMEGSQHVAQYNDSAPDHIAKSISVSLIGDGDMTMGRQSADGLGRLSEELKFCSPDEPKAGSMSDDANICYDPPDCSPDDFACLRDITTVPTLSVVTDMSQLIAPVEGPSDDYLDEIDLRNSLVDPNFSLEEDEDESIRLWCDNMITDGD